MADRFSQQFMHHGASAKAYREALEYVENLEPDTLLIDLGGDWWENPVWVWSRSCTNSLIISHDYDFRSGRTVKLCIGPCTAGKPSQPPFFTGSGTPSPSVGVGPLLTVGSPD